MLFNCKVKSMKRLVLVVVWVNALALLSGYAQSDVTARVTVGENESWFVGVITQGNLQPIADGYTVDLHDNCYGNQAQPLMLSTKGRVVWSEEPFALKRTGNTILLTKKTGAFQVATGGKTLRDAYHYASQNFFPPSGKTPHHELFSSPQYNTWIELLYNQNQKDVLEYAKAIIDNGFPPGVIMIDDNWQEDYGTWKFREGRFPNPTAMVDTLHRWGFKVMLWVCPFISPDSEVYRKLEAEDMLMKDADGLPKMVRWWNGVSAVLDLSDPNAVAWFHGELKGIMKNHHIDGFKLDAGDPEYYVNAIGDKPLTPNEHAELFNKIGLEYEFNEYRAAWKMGGQPLAQRLRDKGHTWGDLQKLIPDILLQGIMGYPFTCPDMIGGGEMGSFLSTETINQKLVVRSAQCHALMPMMQFSVAPWRILDENHLQAIKASISLRAKYSKEIESLVAHAAKSGEPIVRLMEYEFPNQGMEKITDQYMLGSSILVAPILTEADQRTVVLPAGKWTNMVTGKVITGPKKVTVTAPLDVLPFFVKKK
jgi:alpha-glucosidase (family GH31 glycosyl hydrolase)